MEAGHWESLARVLEREGIGAQAADLKSLRHDVELSHRVLRRIAEQARHGAP